MAKSNKIARYLKNSPVFASVSARDSQQKPSGLYLLELRSHHADAQSPLPRRKLVITVDAENGADALPKVVKITHS